MTRKAIRAVGDPLSSSNSKALISPGEATLYESKPAVTLQCRVTVGSEVGYTGVNSVVVNSSKIKPVGSYLGATLNADPKAPQG